MISERFDPRQMLCVEHDGVDLRHRNLCLACGTHFRRIYSSKMLLLELAALKEFPYCCPPVQLTLLTSTTGLCLYVSDQRAGC